MAYTKGPWEYCDGGIFGPWSDELDEKPTIAHVARAGMNGPHTQKGEANGDLIATAPELLEALVSIRAKLAEDDRDPWWMDSIVEIDKLIAKATQEG